VVVSIEADAAPFEATMRQLEGLSRSFGSQLTSGLKSAIAGGKELDDILRRIGLNLAGMALDRALKPLENLMGTFFSSLLGGLMPFARGGVPSANAPIIPFASGGVVSAPTFFPMGSKMGLMGEAGAEAIMPLQRTSDGRLGVAASQAGSPVSVVFNVSTPDAGSFRKSEAQVTGMLARAVARGTRAL
jgi:phage-related minor tail protein